ncbi:hypothetical protein DPMN_099332 [Dreissena polymorpha]|uniref:Uncharacterized protein n=1 Tax=Dreissena polymorpha TaxID=45954 RepID=A0A9D4R6G6_DREPO|nr:hypothetical protein DPMN_099332 [Dreissena polymorpha]
MLTKVTVNSDIFAKTTVFHAPAVGLAVEQTRLGTVALHVIQPYLTGTLYIRGRTQ